MNWTCVPTRSTGAEVAGSAKLNGAVQYTYYRYCHMVMGTHYFYII